MQLITRFALALSVPIVKSTAGNKLEILLLIITRLPIVPIFALTLFVKTILFAVMLPLYVVKNAAVFALAPLAKLLICVC